MCVLALSKDMRQSTVDVLSPQFFPSVFLFLLSLLVFVRPPPTTTTTNHRNRYAEAHVFELPACPHSWLFPRCAAVVHHGGAGTLAAGLRAGCPTVVCPFIFDQVVIHRVATVNSSW